eukprot:996873-Alexandrium_andersonii.AAC.1
MCGTARGWSAKQSCANAAAEDGTPFSPFSACCVGRSGFLRPASTQLSGTTGRPSQRTTRAGASSQVSPFSPAPPCFTARGIGQNFVNGSGSRPMGRGSVRASAAIPAAALTATLPQ